MNDCLSSLRTKMPGGVSPNKPVTHLIGGAVAITIPAPLEVQIPIWPAFSYFMDNLYVSY